MSLKCILQGQDSKNLATKTELNQHIENKSNPHGVTAQQVGAIKFTSRYEANTEEEINNALETIISAGLPGDTLFGEIVISANNLSLLGGGWGVRLHRGNDGYADVIATLMSDDVIRIKTRVKYQGAWMPWRELANDYSIVNALEKKAPNGYGLGSETAKTVTNWDDAKENGFYKGPAPRGIGSGTIIGVTFSNGPLYKVQIVYPDTRANCSAQREMPANGTWDTWEWVNPPMELGVEYRTTERYLDYPVYVKLINLGSLPNAGSTKQISVRDFGIRVPISMDLTWGNFASENFTVNDYAPYVASAGFDNANINIVGGPSADTEHYEVYAFLKYSKSN